MNPQTLLNGGGSRAAATSIIVNGFQPLTIIAKRSILDVAAAVDPPPTPTKVLTCESCKNFQIIFFTVHLQYTQSFLQKHKIIFHSLLVLSVYYKVAHTQTNLQPDAADLFKYE